MTPSAARAPACGCALGAAPEGRQVALLRGGLEVAQDGPDVGAPGRSDQAIVHLAVGDLRPHARLAGGLQTGIARHPARPGIGRHGQAVAPEQGTQRIDVPRKWKDSAAMTDRWRLIDGVELYDMESDPGQTTDVSSEFPEVVSMLREEYEQWWESTSTHFAETSSIPIGEGDDPVLLTSHDLHTGDDLPPWHQQHVRNATGGKGY